MAQFKTPKVNLKSFFKKEAEKNIIGTPNTRFPTYKSLIKTKRGIRLDNAPKNSSVTAGRKGKNHWLVDTGATMHNGFKYEAKERSLRVYANPAQHPSGKVTYKQIFEWHNLGGGPKARFNKKPRYSGVFQKLPVGSKFPERLVEEVGKQVQPKIFEFLRKKFR